MAFKIDFLIRFMSKMNDNSPDGKCISLNFIPQTLKEIGHI